MIISKEAFVNIMEKLRQANDFVNETNEKARELEDSIESDFFNASSLSISFETDVVYLLKTMFNDTGTLSWWLYECDYGRDFKLGDMTVNGVQIDLTTSEKLYDYLVERIDLSVQKNYAVIK